MIPRVRGWGWIALAIACLLVSFTDLPWIRPLLAVITFAVLPGAAVYRLAAPRRAIDPALAIALSPFLLGALMTAVLFAGVSAEVAARVCLLLCAAAFAYDAWRTLDAESEMRKGAAGSGPDPATPRDELEPANDPTAVRPTAVRDRAADDAPKDEPGRTPGRRGEIALALAMTALTLLPLARSERVRASVHGFLHASILYAITDRGVPPENPFFAGETIRYYWTWHAGEAAVCHVGGIDPTVAFAASNAFALLAMLLFLGRLGRHLSSHPGSGPLGMILGFLGMNPLGAWFFSANAAARPEFQGLDKLADGVNPIMYLVALAAGPDERISATLTKFLNVSSFPHSLALLVAAWLLLAQTAARPSYVQATLAALATAGCIALSPITGLTGGLALGAAALLALLLSRLCAACRAGTSGALFTAGALAGGLVLAIPFVLLGGAGKGGETIGLEPTKDKLMALGLALGPILVLALPALWRAVLRGPSGRRILALSTVPLMLMAVVIWFPVASEYKLVRMAAPLLGAFAAATIADALRNKRPAVRIAIAALCCAPFVPTNAIAWRAYQAHSHAALPFHAEGIDLVPDDGAWSLTETYQWLRRSTPEDAVLLTDPALSSRAFAGPMHGEEAPALAHRAVFSDHLYYMTDYEPSFPARVQLLKRLFAGIRLRDEDVLALRELGRPIYAVLRASGNAVAALECLAGDPRWKPATHTDAAFVFELKRGGL